MYSLLIDTHDKEITLVLYKDGKEVNKVNKESLKSHSIYVMPLIKTLISNSSITKDDISEIIVVNGPGSFTGVRIGITIAKTWAYCKEIPLKEISALEQIAVSINHNEEILVGIPDPKGYYIGKFDKNNQLIGKYQYYSKADCDFIDNVVLEGNVLINYNKVYKYVNNLKSINPHSAKPLYIKKIGVEHD